jgi:plasmid maintenance system killer protein
MPIKAAGERSSAFFTVPVIRAIITASVNHRPSAGHSLEVFFASHALEKRLGSDAARQRAYGDAARKIARRLNELHAAPNLSAMRAMPGGCHELRENRAGQLAVDLTDNLRLVFEPADDPMPTKEDGGLDWDRVTEVRIREVIDYHG